jgi:two-component system, LytTR family, sensor kinase
MFKGFTFRKALAFFITWWVVWTSVEWYIISFYGIPKGYAITDAIINISLLILTSIAVFNTIKFYRPTRGNLLYLRIWALLHAWFITALNAWLVVHLTQHNPVMLDFVSHAWPIRYVFNLIMLGIVTATVVIYYYVVDEKEIEERKDDAEKLAKETELVKLRQQLQPHFLFNSLNSISALAGSRPEEARKMIQQLSDFLRGTLRKDEQQLVSLKEELHHLQLYLEIEKVRFGHRLNTHIDCVEAFQELVLPPLLLQPLVENAIKFGLYDTTEQVLIEVTTALQHNELIITVKNPYDPTTAMPRKGTGFGLTSVSRRLYLLFGRTDLLKTRPEETHFLTIIHIPQS